jgi:hypothetical protein
MAYNFKQGYYTPKHPEKYVGDVTKIRYMSSWELKVHQFFDNNSNVLEWASEEIAIPYIKPTTQRIHKYWPDYYVMYRKANGDIIREIIEVKPEKQTRVSRSRNPKTKLIESITFAVNQAKWQACSEWCKKHGMVFRLVTEHKIFK